VLKARWAAPGQRAVGNAWEVVRNTYNDFDRHNCMTQAAALAFFFLLSLFPLLIFLASWLAFVPIPNLFTEILDIMAKFVPADAMGVVRGVLKDVLQSNTKLLSLSIAAAIFAASGGFASLITALNVAYDVREGRPYWKKRLVAFGLTLLTGAMLSIVLAAVALGPQAGSWVSAKLNISAFFLSAWPYIRWALIAIFTILAIETIYFLAPNVKQRFRDQVGGALIALALWIIISWGLGWYLSNFANYNKTFGALGAVVGLMLWLYTTAITLLLGAEFNSELAEAKGRSLREKQQPSGTSIVIASRQKERRSA
jgi:membrane protein